MKCCGCGTETGVWYQDHTHGPRCFNCKEQIERAKAREKLEELNDKVREGRTSSTEIRRGASGTKTGR
jgi:hypothetical protein